MTEAEALDLARRGFRLLPLHPGTNVPSMDGWQHSATSDPERIARWLRCPITGFEQSLNLGIATGNGLVVLDIDCKKADGAASLALLEMEHGELPATLAARTPSGGRHLFFRSAAPIGNSAGKLGPGLDVRGHHGQVAAAGSTAEKGAYAWENDAPVAELPEWLEALMLKARPSVAEQTAVVNVELDTPSALSQARSYLERAEPAIEGAGGNAHTYRTAAAVKDFGVSDPVCLDLMLDHWNQRCAPPWSFDELVTVVANAYTYGRSPPGVKSVEALFEPVLPAVDTAGLCLTPAQWAARLVTPPEPIVGHLITSTSRVMLSADTGAGKTWFGLALAMAAHTGQGLMHWSQGRPSRVLYIDGEMPAGAIKRRLEVACRWHDVEPPDQGIYVLSTADVPKLPALDTKDGQDCIDHLIEKIGGVDGIVFDNLQALTSLSLKEGDSWLAMKDWVHRLSARPMWQLWLHHTGHDGSRAYGDKAREWGMDTVITGTKKDLGGAGVHMDLEFTKARNRDPDDKDSREAFEPVTVELRGGRWSSTPVKPNPFARKPLDGQAHLCLEVLRELGPTTIEAWRDVWLKRFQTTGRQFTRHYELMHDGGWIEVSSRGLVKSIDTLDAANADELFGDA